MRLQRFSSYQEQVQRRCFLINAGTLDLISIALFCITGNQAMSGNPASVEPQKTTTELQRAQFAISERRYEDAEVSLRKIVGKEPNSSASHFLLAEALLHQNKPEESLAEYTEGARWKDPGPAELVGVASDYVLMNDYVDAEKWLTVVVQKAPAMSNGWYLLGRTLFNEHKMAGAEKAFLHCLQTDPLHVRAENNLGLVYENSQRTAEAFRAYQNAIDWQNSDNLKDPQPFLNMGKLLRVEGRSKEALPYLLKGKALAPSNPAMLQQLGQAFEQLGEINEATAALESAVALSPNVQALHFLLGRVYREGGRPIDAQREFKRAASMLQLSTTESVPNEVLNP